MLNVDKLRYEWEKPFITLYEGYKIYPDELYDYNDYKLIEYPWTDDQTKILAKSLFKGVFGFKIDTIC